MFLTASLRSGREPRLKYELVRGQMSFRSAVTYHSEGGMTLTMPDFMPCLSILSMKRLKLRNWSMVYTFDD